MGGILEEEDIEYTTYFQVRNISVDLMGTRIANRHLHRFMMKGSLNMIQDQNV